MEEINNNVNNESITPVIENNPNQPSGNKNIYKYLFFISIIFLLGFIVYFVFVFKNNLPLVENNITKNISTISTIESKPTTANVNEITLDSGDKLFFSTVKDKLINIFIYNPKTNKTIFSKTIELEDHINLVSTNTSFGSSDSVQYNPKTQEIFLLTNGSSEYDGSCINKDGTCLSRIYKISLNETKPKIIFESEIIPNNWTINLSDNSLILRIVEGNIGSQTQTIKKISCIDGNVIFAKSYSIEKGEGLRHFVISPDNKFTYYTSLKSTDNKIYNQVLVLHKINNLDGNITSQEIFIGDEITEDTDISPDSNYLAFYSKGQRQSNNLYVYEIPTKEMKKFPVDRPSNVNLFWSGDSKKLLFWNNDILNYFNVLTGKADTVYSSLTRENEILHWNSSAYFTFKANNKVKFFDTSNNIIIDTPIDASSQIEGINLYQ